MVIANAGGWSGEAAIALVACYAVWTVGAAAFARRQPAVRRGPIGRERRSLPVKFAALGLSAAAAFTAWSLTITSGWYGVVFAIALWLVAALPEAIRLGIAPAVAATVALAVALDPAIMPGGGRLSGQAVVLVSVAIALVFVFLDRPSLPRGMPAGRMAPPDADWQFPLFEELTVAMRDRVVLDGQSLTVNAGEIVVLMGPSGVGKSVLADVAFGLVERLDDVAVSGEVGVAAASGGLVFQAGGGLPHLSVDKNLRLVSSDRKRRRALAERFGLRPRQATSTLSGGERRRIAFVRPMLASRRLLWLDEPEPGLDLRRVDQLAEMLREQADQERMAIVVATHDAGFAEVISDRIVYFGSDGRLVELESDGVAVKDRVVQLLSASAAEPAEAPVKPYRARLRSLRGGLRRGRRLVFDCLGQIPESVPFLLHYVWTGPARSTMLRAFGLSWLRGALYYPFIGAIFGLVFVLTFHLVGERFVVSAAMVIQQFGPEMVLRFAPPISAILIGSAAGSTIASWIGQMSAERHLDALEVLGVGTRRWVLGPAWWGLFVAAVLHAAAFAAAILAVFVAYVARIRGGDFVAHLEDFLLGFGEVGGLAGAPVKVVGYAVLVASITVGCASASLRDSTEVAAAITRAIVWSSVAVMATELLVAAAGLRT